MEHRRVCFCMLSLLPLVQISKLSQANSLLFGKVCCRTPRGVRGLKLDLEGHTKLIDSVAPLAGAWIELSYRGAWSVCRRRRIGARVDSNFHPAPLLFAFLFVDWYSRE